jgi:adenine C2-methylase RlmN of 23S rRNA A2503 and tRNA A37
MGMGEPLMNYNNMMKAIEMITSSEGLSLQRELWFPRQECQND